MCTSTPHRFARRLRQPTADAARLLWFHLRDGRLAGQTFHRQYPVGPFLVDFVAPGVALIVELDELSHARDHDPSRARWLARRGFRVLRVWNHDVLVRTERVLERIHRAIALRMTAQPAPGVATQT